MAKKSLGQNFLIDKNIIKKILNLSNIENRNIVEIGPGNGELTDEILKKNPKSILLIEKDFELVKKLEKKYLNISYLKIYNKDILKFDLEKVLKKSQLLLKPTI